MFTKKTGASLVLKISLLKVFFVARRFLFILFRIHYRYFANDTKERITLQLIYFFLERYKETFSFLK